MTVKGLDESGGCGSDMVEDNDNDVDVEDEDADIIEDIE